MISDSYIAGMATQPEPVRRTDSYLLRLSESERADLEFICRSTATQISDVLRALIKAEAENHRALKKQAKK